MASGPKRELSGSRPYYLLRTVARAALAAKPTTQNHDCSFRMGTMRIFDGKATLIEPLLLERHGGVGILTLNRPDAGNALDLQLSQALMEKAIACDTDPSIRAVLLRANGRFFCVGGDIGAFSAAGGAMPALLLQVTAFLHSAVSRLARMDKLLVIQVQGFAAGGGFGLAMLGDIVIAGDAAQFTLAYSGRGLTPDCGASWLLPRLVGMRKAQEMMLLNPRLDARDARQAGLVTEVVRDQDLAERAFATAQQLAQGPTSSFGRSRALLLSSFTDELETHLEREARAVAASSSTSDGREGVAAFMAKRSPVSPVPEDAILREAMKVMRASDAELPSSSSSEYLSGRCR